jgi:predicted GNAT superfamily acetyltransferase
LQQHDGAVEEMKNRARSVEEASVDVHWELWTDMKHEMELRKATWSAALRLAFVVSALAAIVAMTLSAAGDVPRGALVAAVMVIGFVTSWVQTGRVARVHHEHRVAVVPVRRSTPV